MLYQIFQMRPLPPEMGSLLFMAILIIADLVFLLGTIGAFDGDPVAIIPIVIIAAFADVNIVNIIHRIGLRRSLIVVIFIIVPMVFIMRQFGDVISMVTKLMH